MTKSLCFRSFSKTGLLLLSFAICGSAYAAGACIPPHCAEPVKVCGRVHRVVGCGTTGIGVNCFDQDYIGDYVLYTNYEDGLTQYDLERSTIQQIDNLPEGTSVCVSGDGLTGYTGNQKILYPTKFELAPGSRFAAE